jgi:hypothetical protein
LFIEVSVENMPKSFLIDFSQIETFLNISPIFFQEVLDRRRGKMPQYSNYYQIRKIDSLSEIEIKKIFISTNCFFFMKNVMKSQNFVIDSLNKLLGGKEILFVQLIG